MYHISEKRKLADWIKTKNKAKKRSTITCIGCGVEWTPIYMTPLVKGQYKTTCSIGCTKDVQSQNGRKSMKKLWTDRERMIEISSYAGRQSAAKLVRRSKDEIALFELCHAEFGSVANNEPIVDGWDADIIIDDFKLAVLWNGPWHYRQMPLKNHSLKQVQKRDEIKISKLSEAGYTVLVFEDRSYTPESAFDVIYKLTRGSEVVSR